MLGLDKEVGHFVYWLIGIHLRSCKTDIALLS